ncbi:hypothetical protein FWH09_01205, partial [Candidatus Saccharibacteria bacterium]|nr:hypothetical protein [Candidatus Saccharibacteria bacterium]
MTILLKTLRASWLTILLWCAGIFALNLLLVQAFPVVKSLFENPAEPLPALLNHWLGSGTAWESLSGFISTILISQVSIVIVIFAIIFSLSIFAREERNGLMQTQLAKSISRKTYFWQKYFALVFTLILLSASYYAGIFVGTIILGDTSVGLADLW